MILVFSKRLSSRAARIAPTRPSIISEGATKSAPASAASTAISARISTVASLTKSPACTSNNPSWPCTVYGSSARSVITAICGSSALIARIARSTNVLGFKASRPSSVFNESSNFGNSATAGIPNVASSRHSAINSGIVRREIPGIDSIGSAAPSPSITKIGWIK